MHKRQEAADKLKNLMGDFDSTMKSLHEDEESDALAKDARAASCTATKGVSTWLSFSVWISLSHFHSLLT